MLESEARALWNEVVEKVEPKYKPFSSEIFMEFFEKGKDIFELRRIKGTREEDIMTFNPDIKGAVNLGYLETKLSDFKKNLMKFDTNFDGNVEYNHYSGTFSYTKVRLETDKERLLRLARHFRKRVNSLVEQQRCIEFTLKDLATRKAAADRELKQINKEQTRLQEQKTRLENIIKEWK